MFGSRLSSFSIVSLVCIFSSRVAAESSKYAVTANRNQYMIADGHLHFVNFSQEGDGVRKLLETMRLIGIEHTMLCGMALVKSWAHSDPLRPTHYKDTDSPMYWYSATDTIVALGYRQLSAQERNRVHPFVSGFNPTDKKAIEHIERMVKLFPNTWQGIGEIFFRKDDVSSQVYGENARANHPAMDAVYEYAAKHQLPVLIHSDITSPGQNEPIYLAELKETWSKHPKTKFIWAHAGINRRVEITGYPFLLREILQEYPNVWLDLSSSAFDRYVAPQGVVSKEWLQLTEEFPRRFLIGSDGVGDFSQLEKKIKKFNSYLSALSPTCAQQVAYKNFLDTLPKVIPR